MKKSFMALAGAALLAAALAYWVWQRQEPAPAANGASPGQAQGQGQGQGPAQQSVTLVRAQKRDVPVNIEAAGTVVALNTVDVRPQVSAMIKQVAIREGQFVRKGDLLFALDDRADRANLERARAQLLKDRATLADFERQHKRALELRDQNFVAQSAVDTVLSSLDAQRAAVAAAQAAVHSSEVALGYNLIYAPLSGRAGAITVHPGSLVSSTGAPLVTINQVDPIGVSFSVPEAQLAPLLQASRGEPATVTLRLAGQGAGAAPGNARADAGGADKRVGAGDAGGAGRPGAPATPATPTGPVGRVSFVDSSVDPQSGTIKVKGVFPNPQQQLWPGQYVTARMTLRTIKDAIVVPQAALILGATQQRTLYVVDESERAQLRPVQVRYGFGEFAVVDGVKAGERIVTDGKQNLRPGTPVRDVGVAAGARGAAESAPGIQGGAASTARANPKEAP